MNKSIDEYTIRCTKEQTRKALELGASIEFEQTIIHDWSTGKPVPYPDIATDKNGEPILIKPTAEQMIGWLETQGVNVYITKFFSGLRYEIKTNKALLNETGFSSRPEATLAAIDAALEYLSNNN